MLAASYPTVKADATMKITHLCSDCQCQAVLALVQKVVTLMQ